MRHSFAVELREVEGRDREIIGTILQEGRAASQRRELFAPGSIEWPTEGIAILAEHRGSVESRALPIRERDGRLTIKARATDALREAVQSGKRFLSVEFHALSEKTTAGGIREIRSALVSAAALVASPEYDMTVAEVRKKNPYWRHRWL